MRSTLIVTGASRGIGRAVAELAGAQGWAVAVNYKQNHQAAQAVVAGLAQRGAHAVAIQADVTNEVEVERLFQSAADQLGAITGVVNNAGVVAPLTQLWNASVARIRQVLDVNVVGAFLVARESARRMSTQHGGGGGVLVNVSSIAARLGSPNEYIDYAASKAAVDTLTIGLAKELGDQGVRVNAVRPGLIDTEIHADSGMPERATVLGAHTPLGRPGTAREVAQVICWLLSEEASYMTGSIVDVAGGR